MLHRIVLLILMMALPFGFVQAQTTDNASDFTYQGYLELNGSAVNATCDFTFELYDALIGGNQIGITESASGIVVTEGVFSVQLDFGSSAFNGSDRWLEIGVNDCAGGVTTPLSPRQTITPAAYATYANSAGSVDWGDVNNIPADVADGDDNTEYTAGTGLSLNNNVFSIAASYLLPQCSTTGNIPKWNGTTYICAADNDTQYTAGTGLDLTGTSFSVETNAFWETDGNTGTSVETQFVGTTDNQALVFKVNGLRAFRLEPNNTSPNILGGYNGNLITDDVYGATLSGGGNSGNLNRITDSAGTVSGGVGNTAGNDSGTTFDALYTTVSGGFMNTASAVSSTVGGGDANTASGYRSTINGGGGNNASATGATIGGGEDNIVNGYRGTVGGGATNTASGDTTTIAGGSGNIASGDTAFVGGGKTNIASGNQSSVSGGEINVASGSHATIGGGHNNSVTGGYGTIGGGGSSDSLQGNVVSDNYGTVGGGYSNEAGDGTNADRSAATVGVATIIPQVVHTVPSLVATQIRLATTVPLSAVVDLIRRLEIPVLSLVGREIWRVLSNRRWAAAQIIPPVVDKAPSRVGSRIPRQTAMPQFQVVSRTLPAEITALYRVGITIPPAEIIASPPDAAPKQMIWGHSYGQTAPVRTSSLPAITRSPCVRAAVSGSVTPVPPASQQVV